MENEQTAPVIEAPPVVEAPPAEVPADALAPTPTVQLERFAMAPQTASSANDADRTVDVTWYAGASVPRYDWHDGSEYDLTLDMAGCRMDRLNNGGAVLDGHYGGSVQNQLGVTVKAWVDGNNGKATLRFSMRDAVTPIWNDVKDKIIQNLSPGIWIYQTKDVTAKGQARKQLMAIDWEPFEISLVPVPADAGTEFMSASVPPAAAAVPPVPPIAVQPPVVPSAQVIAAQQARQQAATLAAVQGSILAERARCAGIRQIVALAGLPASVTSELIASGATLAAAAVRVLVLEQAAARKKNAA